MRSALSCRLGLACFSVSDRCLLGEADGALYMAFMGTKQRRDLVTNAQVLQEPIWSEELTSESQEASQVLETVTLALLVLWPSKRWGCAINLLCSPNSCTLPDAVCAHCSQDVASMRCPVSKPDTAVHAGGAGCTQRLPAAGAGHPYRGYV